MGNKAKYTETIDASVPYQPYGNKAKYTKTIDASVP